MLGGQPKSFPSREIGSVCRHAESRTWDSRVDPRRGGGPPASSGSSPKEIRAGKPRPYVGDNIDIETMHRQRPTLGQIVAYFKYQSTKGINERRGMPGARLWQRNYYEHVIRDDADLRKLREYVMNNPLKWELDQSHPDNPSKW